MYVFMLGGIKLMVVDPILFTKPNSFQIHKIEAALEYVIVNLKPPNVNTKSINVSGGPNFFCAQNKYDSHDFNRA